MQSQTPQLPEGGIVVNPFPVVAIGASAGGLEAITQLLQNLSPNTGMAYIYVQHLSPDHKSLLTPLLSKITEMKLNLPTKSLLPAIRNCCHGTNK